MTDSLGWRSKFAVLAPSTNTSVQPEFDWMRPRGVTNHFCRIEIPDDPVHSDEDFLQLLENIRGATLDSVDRAMTCSPDYVVMGMSAETFWDGAEGAEKMRTRLLEKTGGVGVALGSHACDAAIKRYGNIKRIGVITPYMPVGDENVKQFFEDMGYEVAHIHGLKCPSPMLIAHEQPQDLKRAVQAVDDDSVELIIQCGTNLAFAKVAPICEFWLEKPVLAINTCTYWYALRENGIEDRVDGFGSLMLEH